MIARLLLCALTEKGNLVSVRKTRLRALLAVARNRLGSLFGDLSGENRRVLAMTVFADLANVATGYILVAVGVTANVGPAATAIITLLFGAPVFWFVFRPSLRSGRRIWASALLRGISLGMNSFSFQYVLRWVSPQIRASLGFIAGAVFLLGGPVVHDLKKKTYSTALWPILGALGIWLLMKDPASNKGGGGYFDAAPKIHALGHEIPQWAPAVGVVICTSATFAFGHKLMESLGKDTGRVAALSDIPGLVFLVLGGWALEDGFKGVTINNWPYLLICAASGLIGALLSGVRILKAYEQGLQASTIAMLAPLRTLVGILLGMLMVTTAPGLRGVAGICVIIVASYGVAVYQSRSKT